MQIDVYPSFCFVSNETLFENKIIKNTVGYEPVIPPGTSRTFYNNWISLYKNKAFPTGCLFLVLDELKKHKVSPEIHLKYETIKLNRGEFSLDLRDYQEFAIDEIIKNRRLMLCMACGSGKTRVSLELINQFKLKTLYVVPFNSVLEQTIKNFKSFFGYEFVKINDSLYESEFLTIGLPLSILSRIYNFKPSRKDRHNKKIKDSGIPNYNQILKEYVKKIGKIKESPNFDVLIVDEAHLLGASSLFAVSALSDAKIRVGMTGTPVRSDNKDILIWGAISSKRYIVSRSELVKLGHVPDTKYTQKEFNSKSFNFNYLDYASCYDQLHTSDEYNDFIVDLFHREIESNNQLPCLILTTSVDQARILGEKLNTLYLTGEHSFSYRENQINKLKTGEISVLVASQVLSVGFDCPSLRSLIKVGGGESEPLTIQEFGRLDRIFENKSPIIYDISHNYKWFKRHAKTRLQLAKNYGYKIIDLDISDDSDDDFNYDFSSIM